MKLIFIRYYTNICEVIFRNGALTLKFKAFNIIYTINE